MYSKNTEFVFGMDDMEKYDKILFHSNNKDKKDHKSKTKNDENKKENENENSKRKLEKKNQKFHMNEIEMKDFAHDKKKEKEFKNCYTEQSNNNKSEIGNKEKHSKVSFKVPEIGYLENIAIITNKEEKYRKTIEVEEILEKEKEIESNEVDLRETLSLIEKINKIKNKAKKKIYFSFEKLWFWSICKLCKCFINKNNKKIVTKSILLIEKNLEISNLIKKNIEVDFLKQIVMNEDERNLIDYKFKILNVGNPNATLDFLDDLLITGFEKRIKNEESSNEQESM